MTSVWDDIYLADRWGGGSGPGSKAETTVEYRAFLEKFIREHKIKHVLDVGCGDGVLASVIDWGDVAYFGIDPSIEALKKARENCPKIPDTSFRFGASAEGHRTPYNDRDNSLAIVKDVFQHLSFTKIYEVLRSLRGFKHVLVTNDIPTDGIQPDCREGDWRPVDITLSPLKIEAKEVLRFQSIPLMKKTVHIENF